MITGDLDYSSAQNKSIDDDSGPNEKDLSSLAKRLCPSCNVKFSSKRRLKGHIEKRVCQKEKNPEFICSLCETKLSCKASLNAHVKNKVCEKRKAKEGAKIKLTAIDSVPSGESAVATGSITDDEYVEPVCDITSSSEVTCSNAQPTPYAVAISTSTGSAVKVAKNPPLGIERTVDDKELLIQSLVRTVEHLSQILLYHYN